MAKTSEKVAPAFCTHKPAGRWTRNPSNLPLLFTLLQFATFGVVVVACCLLMPSPLFAPRLL